MDARQVRIRNFWMSAVAVLYAAHLSAGGTNQQLSQPAGRLPSAQPTQSGAQIFRTYSEAVAIIEATDGTAKVVRFGSGVLLVGQQVIVTNAHVVIGPGRIRARLGNLSYSSSEIDVLYVDTDADLAVLKLSTTPPRSPIIRLRTGPPPDVGERVFAIGNPQGLERTFSEGVISGVRSLPEIGTVVQHTAPISPGSSGGALFDTTGQLIGLTVAYLKGGQNLNFAVPAASIASAVDQAFDVPNGGISGEISVGFYVKLPGINEVCSKKATLDLQSSGPDLLVGTARFGNTMDSGVRSETFRALCSGLPSGTKSVRLQRVR